MEAALNEFIEKSYEEASLNSIIRNAGISKGTFYYHFRDKQSLYLSLLQSAVDAKMEFLDRRLKNYVHDEDLNLFDSLKLQARFGVEFAKDYPRYYFLGLMFQRERGNDIYKAAMDMLDVTTEAYYDNLLEKAMGRGDFRDGITAKFAKKILIYLLTRFDEIVEIQKEKIDFDLLLNDFNNLIDFIRYGLGKK